mgnify:CR=1 FL=1
MRIMGGLRGRMPLTFATYTVGALSLAGIPPLAAFFSAGIGLLLGGAALRVIFDYGGFSAFSL